MARENDLIRVYSGNDITVNMLKGRLELEGISSTIQNDSGDSFLRGVPTATDLYIQQSDLKKAELIISEFVDRNK